MALLTKTSTVSIVISSWLNDFLISEKLENKPKFVKLSILLFFALRYTFENTNTIHKIKNMDKYKASVLVDITNIHQNKKTMIDH